MKYRIMYCENCSKEYTDTLNMYGENCKDCGNKLKTAWKVIEKEYTCVKFIEACRT